MNPESNWFLAFIVSLLSNPIFWVLIALWLIMLALGKVEAPQ
jgi:hypothetical protein